MASEPIMFTVYGEAKPAGSKRAFALYKRGTKQPLMNAAGGVKVVTTDANPKSREWKQEVRHAAMRAYQGELLRGPLRVVFTFYRTRPKSHFGTGKNANKLKGNAPEYAPTKPDLLKLARGCEDACTGVLWVDDAQIVLEELCKCYGEPARVEICVREINPRSREP